MHAATAFRKRFIRLAGLSLWLVATSALAQESQPPAGQAEPAPIQPIPLQSVLDRAEKTSTELDALLPDDESNQAIEALADEIAKTSEAIRAQLAEVATRLEGSPSVGELEETENELLGHRDLLQRRSAGLDAEVAGLSEQIEQLEQASAVWEATHDGALAQDAGAASLARIASTLEKIDRVRDALAQRRDQILTLGNRLVDQRAELVAAQKQVGDVLDARREGLFAVDQPPIWSPQLGENFRRELGPGWTAALKRRWDRLASYASVHSQVLGLQLDRSCFGLVAPVLRVRVNVEALAVAQLLPQLLVRLALVILLNVEPVRVQLCLERHQPSPSSARISVSLARSSSMSFSRSAILSRSFASRVEANAS